MDIKSKNKFNYIICFILAIYMLSLSVLTGYDLIKNLSYLRSEPYFNSAEFNSELQSYCLNLHSFYITYKNFNDKVAESMVNKNDVESLKLYYEDMLRNFKRDIQNNYTSFLYQAETSGDKIKSKN